MNKHATASNGPPGLSRQARGLLVLVMVIAALGPATVAFAAGITPSKADYLPGETAVLTGAGFTAGTWYDIAVRRPDGSFQVLTPGGLDTGLTHEEIQADANGAFTYNYRLDGITGQYEVRVYALGGFLETWPAGYLANCFFTDSSNLDQYANAPSNAWQNGNLHPDPGANSSYTEDDVVPFRLALEKLSENTTYTWGIKYEFTSGQGTEAYDFLATYNATETGFDVCDNDPGSGGRSSLCDGGTPPISANATYVNFPVDGFVFGPGALTRDGKSVAGAVAAAGEPTQLAIWGMFAGNVAFTPAGVTHTGDWLGGHSEATVYFTFTTKNNCPNNECAVAVAWGGHIASSGYWVTEAGQPNGAGRLNGAPWHMWEISGETGNRSQEKSIRIGTFTAVTLVGFGARAANGQTRLEWQTGTEINNAGFNVLRATSAAGPYVKVNALLIGATGDAVAGASYSFVDKPGPGKFYYKLQDVDLSGKASAHDAVEVTVAWPFLRPAQPPAPPVQ